MRPSRILSFASALLLVAAYCYFRSGGVVFSQTSASPLTADGVVSLRVRLGMTDAAPRAWDGSVTVANGELISVRDWHPREDDEVSGSTWKLKSIHGAIFVRRPWENEQLHPTRPYVTPAGVIVDVKATPGTRLAFQTPNGNFEVDPNAPGAYLNGAAVADLVPSAQKLSNADYENDFPTLAAGANGEMWMAWVAYREAGDDILVRRFDGRAWSADTKLTPRPTDVFLVKMGRDRNGHVWAVWAEQVQGNFDLYGRRFDGRQWSPAERLTDDPQPDVYHNLATDSNGNLWLVWQGFRNGKADIFARRYDGTRWSAAERVSTSPANDWEPAIAADAQGDVYVAWDTYDKGNYDVVMRRYSGGTWSAVEPVAATPKYEAHVSLACDRSGRLWAAWNESGFEWGKDTGFLVKKEATALYQWRGIGTAVYANGAWQETAADLTASLPPAMREYNDFPIVYAGPGRQMWLFFRHRMVKFRGVTPNAPAHRAAWELYGVTYAGGKWSAPVAVPFSQGRIDVRGGFATDSRGNLWAAWHTDNRDFDEFLFSHTDVYAGRVPVSAGGAADAELKPRVVPKLTVLSNPHENEVADLARIRDYAITSGGKTYHIYRGDTHRHTEFSMDGNNDGSLQQTYRYAIDAASLDYLGISDHNGDGGPDNPYVRWLQQQMCDVMMLPRTFTPLYAYERSLNYPNGHRNVIFPTRGIPTLKIPAEERQAKIGAKPLYEYLKRYGGIAISHTSASNMGTDWRDNDPSVEPLVEIYQGDRVSAEYEGAPKAAYAGHAAAAPGGFRPAGYVWNAWAKGYRLGVQASSDHLSTHISYACTIATDFTRAGLVDAMKQRHSYGATDNIVLDYRMQAGGKEYLQGDVVKAAGDFKLLIKVIGTRPVRQIDIIRNNQFVHTVEPMKADVSFTYIDNTPLPEGGYYYVRVTQVDDQMAWSSPIWLTR